MWNMYSYVGDQTGVFHSVQLIVLAMYGAVD